MEGNFLQGRFEANIPELDEEFPKEVNVGLEYVAGEGEREFEPIIRTFHPLWIRTYIEHVTEVVETVNLRLAQITREEAEKYENLSDFFDDVCFEDTKTVPLGCSSSEGVTDSKV